MTVPCEGQLLLLTPAFDEVPPEPIVLGTMHFCPGLMDEYGTQVRHFRLAASSCTVSPASSILRSPILQLALLEYITGVHAQSQLLMVVTDS